MKTDGLNFDAKALREKILDLAMRGKLVKQDPNDEPASVLLKKIKAEKEQLIKEKKIKKSKPLPPITDDEKPFDIPESWEWVRLGDVLALENGAIRRGPFGSSLKKAYFVPKGENTYKVYEQGNAIHKSISYGRYYISQKKFDELESFSVRSNDIIISGAGTIGKTFILPSNAPAGVINQALIRLRLNNNLISNEYFLLAFQQTVNLLNKKAVGTAMKNMFSVRHMKGDLLYPLPPLSEQSRIAAKIAQLFALLRKVESSTKQYQQLQTLLKDKVLDLAMRGKLVKQDPNDEPASVLLDKIKNEKAKLVKEGKVKKSKSVPPITDDEKPYKIPDSWEWVKLGSISNLINGDRGKNYPGKKYWQNKGVPFVNAASLNEKEYIDHKKFNFITQERFKLLRSGFIKKDDILYCIRGSLGKIGISDIDDGAIASSLIIIRKLSNRESIHYIYFVLNSSLNSDFIRDHRNGTAQPNISGRDLSNLKIPFPPFEEQKRIVNEIEYLNEYYD